MSIPPPAVDLDGGRLRTATFRSPETELRTWLAALANEAEWIRVFARHFLDSSSYSAAKHGMALAGGAARGTLTVGEKEIVRAQGSVVSWLARWPEPGTTRPPRWTRVTRIFSTEAYIVMIKVATDLMEGVWIQARALHLGESTDDVGYVSLATPRTLFKGLDLPRHILYETHAPLAYDGEAAEVIAQFPSSRRRGVTALPYARCASCSRRADDRSATVAFTG